MKKICTGLAILGLLAAGGARAVFYDGEALLEACERKVAFVNGVCEGYVTGLADAAAHFSKHEGVDEGFCIPADIKVSKLIGVVVDYLEAHKGSIGDDAAIYVRRAFTEAFPCDP